MNTITLKIFITALALSSSAVFAGDAMEAATDKSAQPAVQPNTQLKKQFIGLDTNKDGMIDLKEAKANKMLSKQFNEIAKDGKLDETGYITWSQAQKPKS